MDDQKTPRHFESDSQYGRTLDRLIPTLVDAPRLEGVRVVIDLLEDALPERGGFSSYLNRPAIEDHEQNWGFGDPLDRLISAARDIVNGVLERDPSQLSEVLDLLRSRSAGIFLRLALHAVRVHASSQELMSEWLLNEGSFHSLELRHEYMLLLGERFGSLNPTEQERILNWINDGPQWDGDEPPSWADHWRLNLLTVIRDDLPRDRLDVADQLAAEAGGLPEHPDLVSQHGSWVGPTSPLDADTITEMGIDRMLAFLSEWEALDQPMSPSVLGIARELQRAVERDPTAWAKAAGSFQSLDEPTYVHHILSGLSEAIRGGKRFEWGPVLKLCLWVVGQPREIPGRVNDFDRDPSWGPARQAVARLLELGFIAPDELGIPGTKHELAWRILAPLARDPEPDTAYEATYGGDNMDPATLSINTVRGVAMHAAVQYGLWRKRSTGSDGEQVGLSDMPELRDELEWHLHNSNDPSLAVRAVFGQHLPGLLYLDEDWVVERLDSLLPEASDQWAYWDAAWWTYVTFSRPYDSALEPLRSKYSVGLSRLPSAPEGHGFAMPSQRLVEHLVVFYLRGVVDLDDDLIKKLFDPATPVEARGFAIEFIGRVLREEQELPAQLIPRAVELWEWRRTSVLDGGDDPRELLHFGWWFGSSRLPDAWELSELDHVLAANRWVEPDHLVVEHLAGLGKEHAQAAVAALRTLVENPAEPWSIFSWRDAAARILSTGVNSSDPETRQQARELANRLVALGFTTFTEIARTPE